MRPLLFPPHAGVPDALAALHAAVVHRPADGEGCVAWACGLFHRWFTADVRALLAQYPPDHVADDGAPFWGGTRRLPTPAAFDAADATHRAFVAAAAALRAASLGLPPPAAADLEPGAIAAAAAHAAAQPSGGAGDAPAKARQRAELLAHAAAAGLPRWSGAPQARPPLDLRPISAPHLRLPTCAPDLRTISLDLAGLREGRRRQRAHGLRDGRGQPARLQLCHPALRRAHGQARRGQDRAGHRDDDGGGGGAGGHGAAQARAGAISRAALPPEDLRVASL